MRAKGLLMRIAVHRLMFLLAVIVTAAQPCRAQVAPPPANQIYVEAFGAAGYYSLNAEIPLNEEVFFRAGLSVLGDGTEDLEIAPWALVPVMAGRLVSLCGHEFELAAGPVFGILSPRLEHPGHGQIGVEAVAGSVAYRYRTPGGWIFRMGVAPWLWAHFRRPDNALPLLWPSFSVGRGF